MDWLAGFAERPTLLAVRRALAGFPRRTEGEVFLAAAEVLAALRGWPREDAPPDVVDWAEKQRRKGADLQAALDEARRGWAALPGCELAALWAESPEQAAWLASVDELRARLEGSARPAAEPLPRRGPSVVLTLAAGEPAVRRRVSQLGAFAGAPSRIQVDLGEDWTDDERAAVVGFCARFPEAVVALVDGRGGRRASKGHSRLGAFAKVRRLTLRLDPPPPAAALAGFGELESLDAILPTDAGALFDILAPLPGLRSLALTRLDPSAPGDLGGAAGLTRLERLELTLQQVQEHVTVTPDGLRREVHVEGQPSALGWVETQRALRRLRGVGVWSAEPILELSGLAGLREVELLQVYGLREVRLPAGLRRLTALSANGARFLWPNGAAGLRQLAVDAGAEIRAGDLASAASLAAVSLSSPDAALLAAVPSLRALESLHLYEAPLPDAGAHPRLRFLHLWGQTAAEVVRCARDLPALEELSFDLPGDDAPRLDDFAALAGHPSLRRVKIASFHHAFTDPLSAALGLSGGPSREWDFLASLA